MSKNSITLTCCEGGGRRREPERTSEGETLRDKTILFLLHHTFLGSFLYVHCVAIFGQVLDQGYPQSGLNINLHLTAVLFYDSIIKNSVTLFFMGLIQTKYGGMFPA